MKFLRYSGVAFESIMSNKLRSILTMLGLIIGVASVLTTIGIGRGAAQGVSNEIEGQGINTLTINPKTDNVTDNSTLTSGDAKALADKTLHPEILAVAPTNSSPIMRTRTARSSSIGGRPKLPPEHGPPSRPAPGRSPSRRHARATSRISRRGRASAPPRTPAARSASTSCPCSGTRWWPT